MVDKKAQQETLKLANLTGKIELAEDRLVLSEEFRKNVAIPYFKDIYRDLVTQSDNKNKGVNKITLLQVCVHYSYLCSILDFQALLGSVFLMFWTSRSKGTSI
jgi:hypothetical protein